MKETYLREVEAGPISDRVIVGVLALSLLGGLTRFVADKLSLDPQEISDKSTQYVIYGQLEEMGPEELAEYEAYARSVADQARNEAQSIVNQFYVALAHAETGSFDNPWIRTTHKPALGSTAYGPLQITAGLVEDFLKRYPELFDEEMQEYVKRYLAQAIEFNRHGYARNADRPADHDPRYDYGGEGHLGHLERDRLLYEKMAKSLLQKIIDENGGDTDKIIRRWRGVSESSDPSYYDKVRSKL